MLSARSPYFQKKLKLAPNTTSYKLPAKIPPQAFEIAIRYLYFGETPNDVGGGPGTGFTEAEVLEGIDKLTKHLEIRSLLADILENDRRLARQRRTAEVEKGSSQLEVWFKENIIRHRIIIDTAKAPDIKWNRENAIFADVLLKADEIAEDEAEGGLSNGTMALPFTNAAKTNGIPIGPSDHLLVNTHPAHQSTLFPVHKAMLIRSEYFQTMFSSSFLEAQYTPHLRIINVDCSPEVLEVILTYLYTEKTDIPLELAVEVLYAADLLLIEKLKAKAAVVISTLGNGPMVHNAPSSSSSPSSTKSGHLASGEFLDESVDIFEVLRAGWATRVPRLEEFAAYYFAQRLERYIDDPAFADLIRESAARIQKRQETDSIELIDDIRYNLSQRFRLRFEDAGLEEMMDGEKQEENDDDDEKVKVRNEEVEKKEEGEQEKEKEKEATGMQRLEPPPSADGTGAKVHAPESAIIRTLDGEIVDDEFAGDAMNYQLLLGKIDALLERLRLDA